MSKHASSTASGFFSQEMAENYDRRNSGLKPISDCLHFLMRLVLDDLPRQSRILCIGVGTGAEILSLAVEHPEWSFVGVDPAPEMIGVARRRLNQAGLLDRCELVEGYVEDISDRDFDAAVSLLVAHFVPIGNRSSFYRAIHDRLRPDGHFVSAEISSDLDGPEFADMLQDWKKVQALMGATDEALASLEETLRNVLSVVPPAGTYTMWQEAGFSQPTPFFQAFMVKGWHARRPSH